MKSFQYHSQLLKRFPSVTGGVIVAQGLRNRQTPPELLAEYQEQQKATRLLIGDTPLSQIPALSAWRSTFSAFGVEPTKYRSAIEALLRRLTKKGDIPSINLLVDIGNLVSIRYNLPVAVFDTHQTTGSITVRLSEGTEHFTPLGESITETPEVGEVIFVDEAQIVSARRWCWRQSAESAARLETENAIITVEAQHVGGQHEVEAALADLQELIQRYAGGIFHAKVLNLQDPAI
jgi:DNA/RNA-binding domain of Phe-tRNA-synthetase-like protein